jgi:hypothetical protein
VKQSSLSFDCILFSEHVCGGQELCIPLCPLLVGLPVWNCICTSQKVILQLATCLSVVFLWLSLLKKRLSSMYTIWICISCYFMDQASFGCHPEFQRMCSMRLSSLFLEDVSLWLRLQFFIIHPPYKFTSEVNTLSAGHFCVISNKQDPTPVCVPSFPSMTAHPSLVEWMNGRSKFFCGQSVCFLVYLVYMLFFIRWFILSLWLAATRNLDRQADMVNDVVGYALSSQFLCKLDWKYQLMPQCSSST